ncbi:hypothetical protein BT69DRAFT_864221 [Atractiella rhizophila]|nr:hypothetical protein BT69DRAFT_864221 [Atractiella rhizophila]
MHEYHRFVQQRARSMRAEKPDLSYLELRKLAAAEWKAYRELSKPPRRTAVADEKLEKLHPRRREHVLFMREKVKDIMAKQPNLKPSEATEVARQEWRNHTLNTPFGGAARPVTPLFPDGFFRGRPLPSQRLLRQVPIEELDKLPPGRREMLLWQREKVKEIISNDLQIPLATARHLARAEWRKKQLDNSTTSKSPPLMPLETGELRQKPEKWAFLKQKVEEYMAKEPNMDKVKAKELAQAEWDGLPPLPQLLRQVPLQDLEKLPGKRKEMFIWQRERMKEILAKDPSVQIQKARELARAGWRLEMESEKCA